VSRARHENVRFVQSNEAGTTRKRHFLSCKNKGYLGRCRFNKPATERASLHSAGAPHRGTAVPHL
jgi:hypothetical protein